LRLLVIEDEERLAGILKSKLGEIGFTVDIADSAEDASIAALCFFAAVLSSTDPTGCKDKLGSVTSTGMALFG